MDQQERWAARAGRSRRQRPVEHASPIQLRPVIRRRPVRHRTGYIPNRTGRRRKEVQPKPMQNHPFTLELEVRDYECDLQGIVNNAVYQHYLEHARHTFLRRQGIDFADLARQGINLVLVRIEIDYLYPLRSGDQFYVGLNLERVSRLRFRFAQDVFRLPDGKPIIRASAIATALNERGRPLSPAGIDALLASAG